MYFFNVIMLLFSMIFNLTTVPTPVEYTSALEDLKMDPSFNENDYPSMPNNDSLDVIQVAISEQNDLFIYVYQPSSPSKEKEISSINLSFDIDYIKVQKYGLKVLNHSGVFYKCKVEGLKLTDLTTINIGIPSIFYKKNGDIIELENGMENPTVSEIACPIGQKWIIENSNGQLNYYMQTMETYVIPKDGMRVGYIDYVQANNWFHHAKISSHYIAFKEDPNYQIDMLLGARVGYTISSHNFGYDNVRLNYDIVTQEPTDKVVDLTCDDKKTISATGFFKHFIKSTTFNRICSVNDFIAQEANLKEDVKTDLANYDWVLRFVETDYDHTSITNAGQICWDTKASRVENVGIFSLDFVQNGKTYKLPVVSNRHNQPSNPDAENDLTPSPENVGNGIKDLWEQLVKWFNEQGSQFMKTLKVLLFLVGILVFAKPIEWILKAVGSIFRGIFSIFKSDDK